jgi:hypothetical protein
MPGGARWDRKVKTKLKKYYFYRYLYTSVYTYAALESGHWHSPCPLAIWALKQKSSPGVTGRYRVPVPVQDTLTR